MKKIGIIIGSLREHSVSGKIATNALKHYEGKADAKVLDISDLPVYNADFDNNMPAPMKRFRDELSKVDSVLFVVPEHNRTMSSATKNAIDMASRPYMENLWRGKTVLLIGHSIGKLGAYGAVNDVRKSLMFLGANVLNHPEVYLGPTRDLFNEDGSFVEGSQGFMNDVFKVLV